MKFWQSSESSDKNEFILKKKPVQNMFPFKQQAFIFFFIFVMHADPDLNCG